MTPSPPDNGFAGLPLGSLPAVALDTETTGLDTGTARIVQIGAVRLVPGETGDGDTFEILVNPGMAIPAAATEIHQIADADVSGADGFATAIGRFAHWSGTSVVIGWSIGFDLAIMTAEHDRHGLPWQPPRSLDVRHLVELLSPNLPGLSLETAAAWLGIEIKDRHTGLGDARLAAGIFRALVPRLREKGIVTLAQAERACRSLTQLRDDEARAGWRDVALAGSNAPASVSEYARIDSYPYRHRIADIMKTPPVCVANDAILDDVLAIMMREQVSSVFLPPNAPGGAYGIMTERDVLRAIGDEGSSALAAPVSRYAVRPLVALDRDEFVYRAMGVMSAHGFRHLGVKDSSGEIVGALSARDLLGQRASDAIFLGDNIEAAQTPAELGRLWGTLTTVVRSLVNEEVDPRDIAAVISRELCALTRRACEIAEQEMLDSGDGPPPAPYAFLVLGSGGRGESLLAMDQDNALVFAEGETGGPIDEWFARLGRRVADILNEVGVVYCTGGVMAANEAWRKDIAGWRGTIDGWLRRIRPEDLLSADIFFDAVPVHGAPALGQKLLDDAVAAASHSRPFLQALSIGAGDFRIPVGWFGRLRGKRGRIDLKKGGLMPLFATARVLALRYRIAARSTPDRFDAARELVESGGSAVDNLIEAHRILLDTILRQQLRDLEAGIALSNSVALGDLTAHQRQDVKWALAQVPSVADVLGTPLSG